MCRSYEVQVIQKSADLMRYRWYKTVRNLRSTGGTKVCRSYQVQVIQKSAELLRWRYYKSVQISWGTGDTKVCGTHEAYVPQKCADLMRYSWYKSVQSLWGTGDTPMHTSVHTSVDRRPAACLSDFAGGNNNGLIMHWNTKRWSQDTSHFILQTQSNGKVNTFRWTH